MKQLFILLFLLTVLPAKSQCNAINVNTFILKPVGTCRYVIEINATLSNGNASIVPFYTCNGVSTNLNCFSWENPSTKTFVSDTILCCSVVQAGIRGHASSNCHGNQCIEVALRNLPLNITHFNAFRDEERVCCTWETVGDRIDNIFFVENSMDGYVFDIVDVFYPQSLRRIGSTVHECVFDRLRQYYRLRVVDAAGNSVISPVKTVGQRKNALEYNTLTRQLWIKGEADTLRSLTVYDTQGHIMFHVPRIKSNVELIPQFMNGVYYVVVHTSQGNLVKIILL